MAHFQANSSSLPKGFLSIRRLWEYRELLWLWTLREIRARYKQSVLGALWAILQPFTLMIVFSVVFANFLRVPTEGIPYPIFSYNVLIFWSFFNTGISFGVNSLVNNGNLLKKVYFPREILLLAAIGAGLFDLLISAGVFVGMLLYYQRPITMTVLWVIPLLCLETLLMYGVVLVGAALNVFYRDIRFVVPLGLQLWMYATPIIYPVDVVPEQWRAILALNPMAGIVEGFRAAILHNQAPSWSLLWPGIIITLVLLWIGGAYFRRVEGAFADVV
jgi:lipopolysaccharide transport system permease protein